MLGVMSSDNPHTEIGKRLRAFRNHLGLTQKAFVDRHNLSPTQYNNWESGHRRIPVEKAAILEERYGLTLDFIYLGRLRTLQSNLADALSESPAVSQYNKDNDTSSS
jgi:transcriptional regulator with XRE-family HTH domain